MGENDHIIGVTRGSSEELETVKRADHNVELHSGEAFIAELAARLAAQPRSQRDWRRE